MWVSLKTVLTFFIKNILTKASAHHLSFKIFYE